MKFNLLWAYFMLSFVAMPALAAADANSCAVKSKQLKSSERNVFIKSCMAQVSASSKDAEQQNKRALCEQNARNQKLEGNAKSSYIAECANKNEAAAAVAASPAKSAAKKAPPAKAKRAPAKSAKKNATTAPGKSCAQQAKAKGLKGNARKKFMAGCQAN